MSRLRRWSAEETREISELRANLGTQLSKRPQYPDVVGERKIIRFLRGHEHNVQKASEMMSKFLKWRDANNVDEIRNNILNGGMNDPMKFPNGKKILSMITQIVLEPNAMDKFGCPICVEKFNFSPAEVLKKITLEEYTLFMIYVLEYRSLIVEQISEERESTNLKILREKPENNLGNQQPYGVVANTCVIRDLSGIGLEHVGKQGKAILNSLVSMASDNYPELMRKNFMINTPMIFATLWYFIKKLLAERTSKKVVVLGTHYLKHVTEDIDIDSIPELVGGKFATKKDPEPYPFNLTYFFPTNRSPLMPLRSSMIMNLISDSSDAPEEVETKDTKESDRFRRELEALRAAVQIEPEADSCRDKDDNPNNNNCSNSTSTDDSTTPPITDSSSSSPSNIQESLSGKAPIEQVFVMEAVEVPKNDGEDGDVIDGEYISHTPFANPETQEPLISQEGVYVETITTTTTTTTTAINNEVEIQEQAEIIVMVSKGQEEEEVEEEEEEEEYIEVDLNQFSCSDLETLS